MTQHLSEEDLILHYYGETGAGERSAADDHLQACEECRGEWTRLKQTLALVDAHLPASTVAPEGFERVMWARVEPKLVRPSKWRDWFAPRRLLLAGGAAVLVLAAFVAGRWSGSPATPQPAETVAEAGNTQERVLLVAVGDHLERSQMVLVELLNTDPAGAQLLSGDRERAADLVATNRLFRQSAGLAGESSVSDVLDDLERVLIEIANGSTEGSAEELELIRARIESRGILFRMRVVTSELRERQRVEQESRRAPES